MKRITAFSFLFALALMLNALPIFSQRVGALDRLDYRCPAVYGLVLGSTGDACTFKVEKKLWGIVSGDTIAIRDVAANAQAPVSRFAAGQRLVLSLSFVPGSDFYIMAVNGFCFPVESGLVKTASGDFPLSEFCAAYCGQHRLLSGSLDLGSLADSLALSCKQSPLHDSICMKIGKKPLEWHTRSKPYNMQEDIVAETKNSNLLYLGVRSTLFFIIPDNDQYEIWTDNGKLEYHTLTPSREGPARVCLYKKGQHPQLVYCKTFIVRHLSFIPLIGCFAEHSVISKKILAAYPKIVAMIKDNDINATGRICQYDFRIVHKGETLSHISVEGCTLTPAVKEALLKAPAGSQAVFSDILCQTPSSQTEALHPLMYILAD